MAIWTNLKVGSDVRIRTTLDSWIEGTVYRRDELGLVIGDEGSPDRVLVPWSAIVSAYFEVEASDASDRPGITVV